MNPAIYVGTYAKYNNGSTFGEWVNLSQFSNIGEFYDHCRDLHEDEAEPELMFQDFECLPAGYVSECHLNPAIFDALDELSTDEYEDFCNFVSHFGKDATVDDFRNSYVGHYNSEADYAYEMMEQSVSKDIPDFFVRYFDYESYARDLFLDDYIFIDGLVYCSH